METAMANANTILNLFFMVVTPLFLYGSSIALGQDCSHKKELRFPVDFYDFPVGIRMITSVPSPSLLNISRPY